jgi:VCBS repeat-containing protein
MLIDRDRGAGTGARRARRPRRAAVCLAVAAGAAAVVAGPAAGIGTITTVAGDGTVGGLPTDGIATATPIGTPFDVAALPDGSYAFAALNARMRRVSPAGALTTAVANDTTPQVVATTPADLAALTAALAQLTINTAVAVLPDGRVLIGVGHTVAAVGADNALTLVAGSAGDGCAPGDRGDGGLATSARVCAPATLAPLPGGGFLFGEPPSADRGAVVRRVGPDGIITTVVGGGPLGPIADGGPATGGRMSAAADAIAAYPDGGFAFSELNRVRRVAPDGTITTIAGGLLAGFGGDGGPATAAFLNDPNGLAVAPDGSLLIADSLNHRIRRIGPDGTIATIAGDGAKQSDGNGGPATSASIDTPLGIGATPAGDVVIAEAGGHKIRLVQAGLTPPLATEDAFAGTEDVPLVVPGPGVLVNDADPQGDPLTAAVVQAPANGTLALALDGSFTYTPKTDFNGTDSFIYAAGDGGTPSVPATVTLTIAPANDAPVPAADAYDAVVTRTLSVPAPGILGNDLDLEGNPLTAALASGPSHGTIALRPNGSFAYVPAPGFIGSDRFTYRVSDGTATSVATAAVAITVGPLICPAPPKAPPSTSRGLALSRAQLLITQRIAQTALYRVNVLDAQLDGRKVPTAPKGGSAGAIRVHLAQMRTNQKIATAALRRANALAAELAGRPAPPAGAASGKVRLTRAQLLITQRTAQAALRRVNALNACLSA